MSHNTTKHVSNYTTKLEMENKELQHQQQRQLEHYINLNDILTNTNDSNLTALKNIKN